MEKVGKKLTNELGRALDELEQEIALFGGALFKVGAGLRASVPLDERDADGPEVELGADGVLYFWNADGDKCPLRSAGMRVRISAVAAFPRLVDAVREQQARTTEVRLAVAACRKLRESLGA